MPDPCAAGHVPTVRGLLRPSGGCASLQPMRTTVPARDGTAMAATLWRSAAAEPQPALVVRTPYGRERFGAAPWSRLVDAGYGLVAVDVRGRGDSEGTWRPWVNDGTDGYDVIEWVAAQPWCDGNVGTIGGSYDAMTQ